MTIQEGLNIRPATNDEKKEFLGYLLEKIVGHQELMYDEDTQCMYVCTPVADIAKFDPEPYSDAERISTRGRFVIMENAIGQLSVLLAPTPKDANKVVHKLHQHIPKGE